MAIFAALKAYLPEKKNLSLFSDCQSAIKKTEKLISLVNSLLAETRTSLPSPSSCSPSFRSSSLSLSSLSAPSPPSRSSPSLSSLSSLPLLSSLSSIENRIIQTLWTILSEGRTISLHWVKAHSGIVQNEMIDQAAKKEAQNRNRESLFEEIPETMGELTLDDKIIENRDEIRYDEWRPD